MATVIRFLRKLLCFCLLCFIFCGVFPVSVYADDGQFSTGAISVSFSNGEISFPYTFRLFDDWINNPDFYSNFTSVMQQLGCSYCLNSDGYVSLSSDMYFDNFSLPISISVSGNWQDLAFSCPINFYFVYGFGSEYSYVSLTPYFIGTASITFSDGTTESINLLSSTSISFSAKKDNSSNQFLISSEDFNLSVNPDDKDSGLTFKSRSDNAQNMPTDELFLSNVTVKGARIENAHSSGLNNLFNTSGDFNNITIPRNVIRGTANLTTGAISATASGRVGLSLGNFSLSLAIMYIDRLILPEISSTTAGVSVKNAEFEIAGKAVIDEAPVTIVPASENVIVTNFSISGSFYFPVTTLIPSGSIDFLGDNNLGGFFVFNNLFTYGISENLLARIASATEGIYYTLRYDIPLAIRHLLIPTQEEVKDVLEESFDNIAEEYPGAAGTIDTIKNQFADFNASISGSSTRGLVLPGITVSVPGSDEKVKLWEDFDLLPYLQSGPARSLMYWVELMLKALIFIYLVRQAASMFISAVTGYSYIEWFGLSNKPFMGDDTPGEALPDGYLDREVG